MNPVLIHPGIYRIKLPLAGKKPGPVNVYLFKGTKNITLLDTGTYLSWRYLEQVLGKIKVRFRDIDCIVMTHGHVDHYGAAKRIFDGGSRRAMIFAHGEDVSAIEKGDVVPAMSYHRFLILTGTPLCYHFGIVPMFLLFRKRLARTCPVHVHLKDNDTLTLGDYTARVIETPGHTRGSICLHLENEGLLFSGDHILGHITPNAFPMLEKDRFLPLRKSQIEFYKSLDRIRTLGPCLVHPAHGKAIRDFPGVHGIYEACFAARQAAILETIRTHPGQRVYDMARALFPDISGHRFILDLYLAVSEIFTHIQVLEVQGRVRTELINRILHVEYVK